MTTVRALTTRDRLLEGLGATERSVDVGGLPTAIVEAGDGPPLVLLHGPGESAVSWRWVLPALAESHRVLAPDLPAHGLTPSPAAPVEETVPDWLEHLLTTECEEPAVLVGHVLGGALAARAAIRARVEIRHLVLVDALGLGPFRPRPRFAFGLARFVARPTERSYERFMRQCAGDLDDLQARMGDDWPLFAAYNLELARSPTAKDAGRVMRRLGVPRIPDDELARIAAPTTLVWGRQDRATSLRVAERAHERFAWPLRVVEDAADDPARDRPEAFVRELRAALAG